ncbi:hypothetical protein [Aquimarina hainanensis]
MVISDLCVFGDKLYAKRKTASAEAVLYNNQIETLTINYEYNLIIK